METDPRRALERLLSAPSAAYGRIELALQSEAEQVLQLVWEVLTEVGDGAFVDYFAGPSGEHARQAAGALRTIGARSAAENLEKAIALVGEIGCIDETECPRLPGRLSIETLASLSECDEQFGLTLRAVCSLLYQYVARNREAIRGARLGDLALRRQRRRLLGLVAAGALTILGGLTPGLPLLVLLALTFLLVVPEWRLALAAPVILGWPALFLLFSWFPFVFGMPLPGTEPGQSERAQQYYDWVETENAKNALPRWIGLLAALWVGGGIGMLLTRHETERRTDGSRG